MALLFPRGGEPRGGRKIRAVQYAREKDSLFGSVFRYANGGH